MTHTTVDLVICIPIYLLPEIEQLTFGLIDLRVTRMVAQNTKEQRDEMLDGYPTSWWATLTLRRQVTILIVLFVVIVEAISIAASLYQVQREHDQEISNAGLAFVHDALGKLVGAPPNTRTDVARALSFGGRNVSLGEPALQLDWSSTEHHAEFADELRRKLMERGHAVDTVRIFDQSVLTTQPADEWLERRLALAQTEPPGQTSTDVMLRRVLALIRVKLDDHPTWFNFYMLLPEIELKNVIVAAALNSLVAIGLCVPLIWLVGVVMRPMRALAVNADQLGRGETIQSIRPQGSTDVRNTIESFNRMGNRIVVAREYQAAMLRSLSHDLKGPLGGAARALETLPEQESVLRIRRHLNTAQESIEAISGFAHATRRDGEAGLVDLPSLIDALVEEQVDMGHEGTVVAKGSVAVPGRRNALSRAFQNLIENGIKYGNSVAVTLQRDDRYAIVHVDDNGPGIEEDQFERVFRPFERLSHDKPGSGFGLSITRAIIVDHGGTIELANRAEGGMRATVKLPLAVEKL